MVAVSRPFDEYRDSALWTAIEETLLELTTTREIVINTAPAYMIGYLCQQLRAKGVISSRGLEPKP